MREMTKHKPKFNVGDKVRHIWGNEVYPVTGVTNKGYQIKGEGPIPFDDEVLWELVEQPKFKVGDRVKHKLVNPHNPATQYIYTVTEIEDDIYHKYCLDHDDHESWIPISEQNNLELVEEPQPKLKLGVDLNEELRIDTLWKDTLANMVTDITKRNTDSFVWLIDETLKFMDCGAYDEMACNGMRLFAKELKKRLGYES